MATSANTPASAIRFTRLTGMYGTCKVIKVYRGREEIGDSYFSVGATGGPLWYIEACGLEGTLRFDATKTTEENLVAVENAMGALVAKANPFANAPILSLQDQIDGFKSEIERLRPKAETGEQWAHICWLEAQMVNLQSRAA